MALINVFEIVCLLFDCFVSDSYNDIFTSNQVIKRQQSLEIFNESLNGTSDFEDKDSRNLDIFTTSIFASINITTFDQQELGQGK